MKCECKNVRGMCRRCRRVLFLAVIIGTIIWAVLTAVVDRWNVTVW